MKIIRFQNPQGQIQYAGIDGENAPRVLHGDVFGEWHLSDELAQVEKLLAPVMPSQIWCIGLNYRQHAQETNAPIPARPIVFAKGINTVQNPGDPIWLPASSQKVDYECELAFVIGQPAKNVSRENALDYVLGYTGANDISARDWQIEWGGGQWSRGKTFDSFCPLGPVLTLKDEIPDPGALAISTVLNGQKVQNSSTADLIFDVPSLIEFLSHETTLPAGTIVLTGTPQGVGMAREPRLWLRDGDSVSVEIENIGVLTNPVRKETSHPAPID